MQQSRFYDCRCFKKAAFIIIFQIFLLLIGICPVNKNSIDYLLSCNGTGNAVVIVVGGAAESLHCAPGMNCVTLKNRKGFVKLALQKGWACRTIFKHKATSSPWRQNTTLTKSVMNMKMSFLGLWRLTGMNKSQIIIIRKVKKASESVAKSFMNVQCCPLGVYELLMACRTL